MKTKYLVIGFSDKTKCADFGREYVRKANAKRTMRKMSESGRYQKIVLREEKIYVDTLDTVISTSTPVEIINRKDLELLNAETALGRMKAIMNGTSA